MFTFSFSIPFILFFWFSFHFACVCVCVHDFFGSVRWQSAPFQSARLWIDSRFSEIHWDTRTFAHCLSFTFSYFLLRRRHRRVYCPLSTSSFHSFFFSFFYFSSFLPVRLTITSVSSVFGMFSLADFYVATKGVRLFDERTASQLKIKKKKMMPWNKRRVKTKELRPNRRTKKEKVARNAMKSNRYFYLTFSTCWKNGDSNEWTHKKNLNEKKTASNVSVKYQTATRISAPLEITDTISNTVTTAKEERKIPTIITTLFGLCVWMKNRKKRWKKRRKKLAHNRSIGDAESVIRMRLT